MNVVIISGGTGSIALQTGLKRFNPKIHITNLVNAYDDGKSTGHVRKVFNVLGPSDIRKNQYTQWKNVWDNDARIDELFERRFETLNRKEALEVIESCTQKEYLAIFKEAINHFFDKINDETVKDYNIMNIVYGHLFQKVGYLLTISMMKKYLNIEDDVMINATSNMILIAKTNRGRLLSNEASIVNLKNPDERIVDIEFQELEYTCIPNLIPQAYECILNADIIICSAGTQWSSLIPTYKTKGFNEAIRNSKAKKYIVVNNEEDSDMLGVGLNDWVSTISRFIDHSEFKFLVNNDACPSMREFLPNTAIQCQKFFLYSMGNKKGKHDPDKLARAIFDLYYFNGQQFEKGTKLFFDFDDTLYARHNEHNYISYENMKLLDNIAKNSDLDVAIISGNSYERIQSKISHIFGPSLKTSFSLFCDGGLIKYERGKKNFPKTIDIEKIFIEKSFIENFDIMLYKINRDLQIEHRGNIDDKYFACYSICKLEKKYRDLLFEYLNAVISKEIFLIRKTGLGTIDITKKIYDKSLIFDIYYNENDAERALFIGDECEFGNDSQISQRCKQYIQVEDVYETHAILRTIQEKYHV